MCYIRFLLPVVLCIEYLMKLTHTCRTRGSLSLYFFHLRVLLSLFSIHLFFHFLFTDFVFFSVSSTDIELSVLPSNCSIPINSLISFAFFNFFVFILSFISVSHSCCSFSFHYFFSTTTFLLLSFYAFILSFQFPPRRWTAARSAQKNTRWRAGRASGLGGAASPCPPWVRCSEVHRTRSAARWVAQRGERQWKGKTGGRGR